MLGDTKDYSQVPVLSPKRVDWKNWAALKSSNSWRSTDEKSAFFKEKPSKFLPEFEISRIKRAKRYEEKFHAPFLSGSSAKAVKLAKLWINDHCFYSLSRNRSLFFFKSRPFFDLPRWITHIWKKGITFSLVRYISKYIEMRSASLPLEFWDGETTRWMRMMMRKS